MGIKLRIWIDADACPNIVKEVVYRASGRLKLPVTLVANSFISIPVHPLVNLIQVEQGDDVADFYIVEHCEKGDLIVTADIPLAAEIVKKEAFAINPRGELYTEENIQERLSVRDFMKDLRDGGVETGGPAPLGPKDKERFTNGLNKILTQLLK